jgi:outer membrane protein
MVSLRSALFGLLAAVLPMAAGAADLGVPGEPAPPAPEPFRRFYLHIGPAGLIYSEGAKMRAGGTPIPGADIRVPNSLTAAAEIGYFLTPNIAIGLAGGYPPLVKVEARGSITGLGTLGKVDGGPMALTAQYHFTGLGRFQPYIGLGPSLMIVFKDHDGAVSDLKTDHALGFAGQIGFNYMIDGNWGVFFDLKKVYLRAKTSGSLGGLPIRATATLDPLVLHTGLTYRF